jgi:hypothetical protein
MRHVREAIPPLLRLALVGEAPRIALRGFDVE